MSGALEWILSFDAGVYAVVGLMLVAWLGHNWSLKSRNETS